MNKVQSQIYNNIVKPAIDGLTQTTLAQVVEYDTDNNIAAVIIDGIDSNAGYKRYPNVPVQLSQGIKSSAVYPGDVVVVEFFDGNGNTPVITGVVNQIHQFMIREKYEQHEEAGGTISDLYRTREGKDW